MDLTLQWLSFGCYSHIKYILFRATTSNDCIGCFYVNNYKNFKEKYEIPYNSDVNYLIKHQNRLIFIKDYLLDIKVNGINLFIRAEQDTGKYETDIFIVYLPTIKQEVYKQINCFYTNKFRKKNLLLPQFPL